MHVPYGPPGVPYGALGGRRLGLGKACTGTIQHTSIGGGF